MSFREDTQYLILDYETFSEANLKATGAYEYASHASTEILCIGYRLGAKAHLPHMRTVVWSPLCHEVGHQGYMDFIRALLDPRVIIVAHNAGFERVITMITLALKQLRNHRHLSDIVGRPERWLCTASLAAALALPRKLEAVAKVLGLKTQKDMDGHRLMLKWAKPRKPTKHNPATRHQDPDELQRVMRYCGNDVDVEAELLLRLPLLTPDERRLWCLDQEINSRGFLVDRPLVKAVLRMIDAETKELTRETREVTGGVLASTAQVAQALAWLEGEGCFLPNLQAKTVADALADGLAEGRAKRLLEIRQAAAKTSTKKYKALELRSRVDGRIRDNLVFHGASTGRWAGSGVQIQNFPRGKIKEQAELIETLKAGDLQTVRDIFGDPMEAFASALRGMIRAPKGHVLDAGDFNAIELRVLFWVAKHEEGLKALRSGRDLYCEQASDIFGRKITKDDGAERWLGKTVVLGAGYGLGHKKFALSCKQQGQEVSEELAERAIRSYRTRHRPVPLLWSVIEKAARAAVESPGKKYSVNYTAWWVQNDFLWCELPSGRRLAYHKPSVRYEVDKWKNKRPVLYHWGTNPRTKKWGEDKTWGGVLVENCLGKETLVLSNRGWVRIIDVSPDDLIFDGVDWVGHGGLLDQGMKEIGEWAGVHLTGNHLILAGESWKSAMDLDETTSFACLAKGRASVPWWLRNQALARILAPFAPAIAGMRSSLKPEAWLGVQAVAETAGMRKPVIVAPNEMATGKLLKTQRSWRFGFAVSRAFCHAAITRIVRRIKLGKKLWRTTGKHERVYDLLDCGPRHRFVIMTDLGPAIIHNCVQAIARDIMAAAMLRISGITLTVHDELVRERDLLDPAESLEGFIAAMETLPPWATGLPIKVEGWSGKRYRK